MDNYKLHVGRLKPGPLNSITDVAGIQVGHCTLSKGSIQTGVTVVLPPSPNLFQFKIPAAVSVINGFGKSVGLIQIEELGQLETPIALTNTFSVSDVAKAQIRQTLVHNPECGRSLSTVNPLVLECNDGYLNDLHAFAINETHYIAAIKDAQVVFEQGAVGAGRGMTSFGVKGGIGSASRIIAIDNTKYTVGALVLANFGRSSQLLFRGNWIGKELEKAIERNKTTHELDQNEKGSIIIIIATDAPLESRQLKRLSKRSSAGLARTGSVYGHGSGDIAIAFSTAYTQTIDAQNQQSVPSFLHETVLDPLFEAVVESVEHAILNALWHATTVTGRDGHERIALRDVDLNWESILS